MFLIVETTMSVRATLLPQEVGIQVIRCLQLSQAPLRMRGFNQEVDCSVCSAGIKRNRNADV
jgi:hypothetical protein